MSGVIIFSGYLLVGIKTVKLHMELPCHSKSTLLESQANGMSKQFHVFICYQISLQNAIHTKREGTGLCLHTTNVASIEVVYKARPSLSPERWAGLVLL